MKNKYASYPAQTHLISLHLHWLASDLMWWRTSIICALDDGANAQCDHLRGLMALRSNERTAQFVERVNELVTTQDENITSLIDLICGTVKWTFKRAFWNVWTKLLCGDRCAFLLADLLLNHNVLWFFLKKKKKSCRRQACLNMDRKKHTDSTTLTFFSH